MTRRVRRPRARRRWLRGDGSHTAVRVASRGANGSAEPARPAGSTNPGGGFMGSDDTRKLLKLFGVAVTNLEEAIDRKAPREEIMKLEQEIAERAPESTTLVRS